MALNADLLATQAWGREEIARRADMLADQAIRVWPGPLLDVEDGEPGGGFDWSAIDAAIQAVPAGNWTAYGDLAELGGTAAVPVGAYCASPNAPATAYRVLTNRGQISAGFRWTDPADTRDVRTVLEEEGLRFDAQDAADQGQRLYASDLQGRLENGLSAG